MLVHDVISRLRPETGPTPDPVPEATRSAGSAVATLASHGVDLQIFALGGASTLANGKGDPSALRPDPLGQQSDKDGNGLCEAVRARAT